MYIDDDGIIVLSEEPKDLHFRPSIDVLFTNLAESTKLERVGVLLTGMGSDGAEGLLALRSSGALTIAQDATTSIVYGMPKMAAERSAATEILPLNEIGPRVVKFFMRDSSGVRPKVVGEDGPGVGIAEVGAECPILYRHTAYCSEMAGTNQVKVTFWGVRGSIPTPQAANLGYGGETACVVIEAEGARLVLDAGSGVRALGAVIAQGNGDVRENILLSHFHWDHVQGMPYFVPLYGKGHLHFHAQVPADRLHANLAAQMTTPFFPLEFDAAPAAKEFSQFTWHTPFTIGPFQITPFPLNHPQDCTGFRVECGGRVIVYATDHEHGNAEKDAVLQQYATGADILITDAQYTPDEYAQRKGFGHSTWMEAAKLAAAAQVGRLVLFHHDPHHSDEALRQIVLEARKVFARTEAARERTTLTAGEGVAEAAGAR